LSIFGDRVGNYLTNVGAVAAILESTDMDEYFVSAIERRNEAEALVIFPGCDFSFVSHN
jgi:hypothetical protein